MPSVTLSAYEVTIRRKKSTDKEALNDFNNGNDIFDFLTETLTKWSYEGNTPNVLEDSSTSKRLRISKNVLTAAGRKIEGVIESGEYGYETNVVNGKGKETKKIEKDESPMIPFYFIGFFPKNKSTGILIFQKFKTYGVYGVFNRNIKKEFARLNGDYMLEILPLVSSELVDRFFDKGALRKVSFKKKLNNKTIVTHSDRQTLLEDEDYYTEFNIVANRGKELTLIKRLKAWVAGKDKLTDLVAIKNYEYNEIKATLKLENHTRTISLSGLDKIGAFFDITDEVTIDTKTGLPEFESVSKSSKAVLDDVIKIAGLLD